MIERHPHFATAIQRRDFGRLCAAMGVAGLGLATGAVAQPSDVMSDPSLKAVGEKSGILFGLCEPGHLLASEEPYFNRLATECSLLSPGNDFHWAAVQPNAGDFHYSSLDAIANFCRARNLGVIGHTLAWYYTVPAWAKAAEPNDFAAALDTYITKTVQRYAEVVKRWDVVNEAVHPRSTRDDGLRESTFVEKAGPGYIRDAFITARRAAPHALLCLNEYGIEYDEPDQKKKRAQFLTLIRTLREANAPIDVIGLQSHLDASKRLDLPGMEALVREIKALGFRMAITELDVNDQKLPGEPEIRDRLCAEHVDAYLGSVFTQMRPITITTWGYTDGHSWLGNLFKRPDGRPLRPLAFDDQFMRKPLWRVLHQYITKSAA